VQAGQLSEGPESLGIMFVACDQPSVILQPGDRPLHLPPAPVPLQRSAILSRRPLPTFAVGTDQLDPIRCETLPQRIRVGRPVVDQPDRVLTQNVDFLDDSLIRLLIAT